MSSKPPGGGQQSPTRPTSGTTGGAGGGQPSHQPPSIRLSLGGGSGNASATSSSNGNPQGASRSPASTAPPATKRRRYTPVVIPSSTVTAAESTVLHQTTALHFVLHEPVTAARRWFCRGEASLYIIVDALQPPPTSARSNNGPATSVSLALHLRGSCRVKEVEIECMSGKTASLESIPTTFFHGDPLQHVLIKPFKSYSDLDIYTMVAAERDETGAAASRYKFDADAQSSRGATGMTSGLRAASIASNMGELRIAAELAPSNLVLNNVTQEAAEEAWHKELAVGSATERTGCVVDRLRQKLAERCSNRRTARLAYMARHLAAATLSQKGNRAFKITVRYDIPLGGGPIHHLAGLHALLADHNPLVYTTTGVVGDHEGPRCWVPCLDSALAKHRCTQEISIQVTAPYRRGISCVGMGQDFGCTETLLHRDVSKLGDCENLAKKELGLEHIDLLRTVESCESNNSFHTTRAHIIPPDTITIDMVQATTAWCSHTWMPCPARSLGFAIGPFKIIEDPEYFGIVFTEGMEEEDDDDDDELAAQERLSMFLESARNNGEGIRQAYLAPIFERKFLHRHANTVLMPKTYFKLSPLTAQQQEKIKELDKVLIYSTIGVPHRALTLMRDVLAVPTYRTSSYTQVWIPNAVHGGASSGALHNCPEVLVNPFLGGAIMDSRLLPPVGSRLPFHQGGRVLQFLQARSVVRGWITAALPLGGCDDVGMGYLLALIESFLMSIYERGHGAQGEGTYSTCVVCSLCTERYTY